MGEPLRYTVRFEGLEGADAGRAAESLRRSLQEVDPTIQSKRVRTDSEAMDLGGALEIVLAAPAILELAKGITAWLQRTHTSKVTITGPDGSTVVENISARDAADLARKLSAKAGKH